MNWLRIALIMILLWGTHSIARADHLCRTQALSSPIASIGLNWFGRCGQLSSGTLTFGQGSGCVYRFWVQGTPRQPVTSPCSSTVNLPWNISGVEATMLTQDIFGNPRETFLLPKTFCSESGSNCVDGNDCTLDTCLETGVCWNRCKDQPPQPCPGGDCGRCVKDEFGNCGCF